MALYWKTPKKAANSFGSDAVRADPVQVFHGGIMKIDEHTKYLPEIYEVVLNR